jgi:hypothetical protein
MTLSHILPSTFNVSLQSSGVLVRPVVTDSNATKDAETAEYFFENANEGKFLALLKENNFFDRVMTEFTHSPINALEDRVRRIAAVLDARWEHDPNDLKPFYRDADFIWLYASTEEVPHKRLTYVALLRFPNNAEGNGDLVYIEGGKHTAPEQFLALREAALKLAGLWYEGMLPPHANTAMWLPYMLDCPLLEFMQEGVVG